MELDERFIQFFSSPKGIRTPVASVKGRCPRPLDDGAKNVIEKSSELPAPCEITVQPDPPSRQRSPSLDLGLARRAR